MKHLTLTMPLTVLCKGLGLPDGIEVVAVREGDNNMVHLKIVMPVGIVPPGDDDPAFVLEGVTERPKCTLRAVPNKSSTVTGG